MRSLFNGRDRTSLTPSPADPNVITSRKNPFIDDLRNVRDDPAGDYLFLEGPKLLEEALKSNLTIEELVIVPEILNTPLIQTAFALARHKTQVTPYVLNGLSDVETPQGVVAIARKRTWTWDALLERLGSGPISKRDASRSDLTPGLSILVVLDGIQNAGNAATIVRTAEATGAAGMITTPKSARLFSPKALRGAMGSSLRLPILEHQPIATIVEKLARAGYSIVTTSSPVAESLPYTALDWTMPWAIVLGQEGNGLSPDWVGKTGAAVHIPMVPAVESLNVAAAAAILLYEAHRKNNLS